MPDERKAPSGYVQPASNTKGPESVPAWRDPERAAQNWRDCARYLRRYFVALLAPGLILLWLAGYLQGQLEAGEPCACAAPANRNERNPK